MGNLKILANSKTGAVVSLKTIDNPETGEKQELASIMVQSQTLSGFSKGIARIEKRIAYATIPAEALDIDFFGNKQPLSASLIDQAPWPFEGKIVVKETLTPYVKKDGTKQEPKINPRTGEIITFNGSPVYRNTLYTEDMSDSDVFLRESKSASMEATSSENSPE